ncbi:hypothetical protein ACWD6Q_36035, partial [Streptomyces nigra]
MVRLDVANWQVRAYSTSRNRTALKTVVLPARYNFLQVIKPRLRSAPPGALPVSGCARAPAFGPL